MNAVVERRDQALAQSEATSVLQIIERAASNPQVDIDKLERLLQLRERMQLAEAEKLFNAALSAVQKATGRISADATNPQTHSDYASYAKLDKVLRPIYTEHGLSLSFDEGDSPKPEHVRVLCHVSHTGGFTRTYHKDMPADGKGAKGGDVMTKTHATGAAQSYGMRYLLKGIFNIAVGEEDRDGNETAEATLSESQVADLDALLTETGSDKALFMKWAKISRLDQILAKNYDYACREIRARAKARATK